MLSKIIKTNPAEKKEKIEKKKDHDKQDDINVIEFSDPEFPDDDQDSNHAHIANEIDVQKDNISHAIGYNKDFVYDDQDSEMDNDDETYVKTGKLVIFVDSNQEELARSKSSFEGLVNFKGDVKFFINGEQTLRFLSQVRTQSGQ